LREDLLAELQQTVVRSVISVNESTSRASAGQKRASGERTRSIAAFMFSAARSGPATGGRRGRQAYRGEHRKPGMEPAERDEILSQLQQCVRKCGTGRADGFRGTAPREAKGRLMEGMLALMIPIVAVGGFSPG